MKIHKYPRTQHIETSGLQRGDDQLEVVPFRALTGRHLLVEEKLDGANCALSFDSSGRLLLQSRGHFLGGGERERQFELFKRWAPRFAGELWQLLGDRYIMYGEWLYAKHTIFYARLPHYFMEFDIYDILADEFLSTERRQQMLASCPFISSVRVLRSGVFRSLDELVALVGPSLFIGEEQPALLREICAQRGLDYQQALRETDPTQLMEGLYIKLEEHGVVRQRYKYVRPGFLQAVFDSQSHWMSRPLLPNQLAPGVTLF